MQRKLNRPWHRMWNWEYLAVRVYYPLANCQPVPAERAAGHLATV